MTLVQPPAPAPGGRTDDPGGPGGIRPRHSAHASTTFLLTLLGCAAVLTVLYIVAVRTGIGQRVDRAAVLHHHLVRTPDADVATSNRVWLLATVLLAPAVIWYGRRNRRGLIVNGCAAAVSVLLAEVARKMLERPSLGPFDPLYGASFPSGHAAAAMGLALAVVALADGTWVRRLVPAITGFVAAFALAIPTHRPSDLIAGFVLALGTVLVAQRVGGLGAPDPPYRPVRGREWRTAVLRSVGLTVVLLVAEALALRRAHLTLADLGYAFPIAVLAVVGGAEVTVVVFRAARSRS